MAKKKFDYAEAVAELEALVKKAEDPSAGIDDIGKYIEEAGSLVRQCRVYLRTAREKLDMLDDSGHMEQE